jgi:hypothetical protein
MAVPFLIPFLGAETVAPSSTYLRPDCYWIERGRGPRGSYTVDTRGQGPALCKSCIEDTGQGPSWRCHRHVSEGDLLLEMSPRIRISIGPRMWHCWYQWAQDKGYLYSWSWMMVVDIGVLIPSELNDVTQ